MTDFLFYAVAAAIAVVLVVAAFSARLTVRPGRTRAWSTPKALGMEYEDVTLAAQDGVRLVGWFVPAPGTVSRPAPTILVLHGWPWCRMGTPARSLLNDLPGSRAVNLLPFIKQLHDAGYHVLTVDHRNFGESESRGVVTGGWLESRDVLGELEYLRRRPDVDADRIAAIGFSQGGATLMFAAPQTDLLRAAVAVQPTTPDVFGPRYARSLMGPLAAIVRPIADALYRLAGGPSYSYIQPALAVAGARIPFLFIQGTGDRWGSRADVERMATLAPHATALYPETRHRFEGYTWVLEHPDVTIDFFRTHLPAPASAPRQRIASAHHDPALAEPPREHA